MTQTNADAPARHKPDSGKRNSLSWLPLARHAIRRLQSDLAQEQSNIWEPGIDPEDMDLPELLEAAMLPSGSAALDALNNSPCAQNISPEEDDAIAESGGDPTATANDGTSQPRIRLPVGKLLPLLRLVVSIGGLQDRDAMLLPGAMTMIEGIPGNLIDALKRLLPHVLPTSWSMATSMARLPRDKPCLLVLDPDLMSGEVSESAERGFVAELGLAMEAQAPILILLPDVATAPEVLHHPLVQRQSFAPLSTEILITALRAIHSATGRIDEQALRSTLPKDELLSRLDALALGLAMRAPTAKAVAERLAALAVRPAAAPINGPRLEDIHGDSPALRVARQIVRDLRAWKAGHIGWQDLTRTLLLYGPPGTGKSWIARAMGNSAGFSVVTGTFGQWQAAGHLGDMLGKMRKTFADARAKAPTVLIIDEIDAVGSREDRDSHGRAYRMQVINAFLAELDAISREEGVIVVGTCNHPDMIDPAVLRPGRIDMKLPVPLPDAEGLFGVFRHSLPDWSEGDLRHLARRAVGCSAADVDGAIRQARAEARGAKRDLTPEDLSQVFQANHDPDIARRVALHESGHAIACVALDLGPVRRIFLDHRDGGGTLFDTPAKHGLLRDLQNRMVQLLAGRAAERLVLGEVSTGAGGGADSDLARATGIASGMQAQYGLGGLGPVWSANPEALLARDPGMRSRVRRELEAAEQRATQILSDNRQLLEDMAEALTASRDMDQGAAQEWLARVRVAAPDKGNEARSLKPPE